MVPLLRISAAGDVASSLQRGAVLREIFVRSLSYVHMEEDALGGLFGDAAIESICRAAAGCTVDDVRSVFNAMTELHDHAWVGAVRGNSAVRRQLAQRIREVPRRPCQL